VGAGQAFEMANNRLFGVRYKRLSQHANMALDYCGQVLDTFRQLRACIAEPYQRLESDVSLSTLLKSLDSAALLSAQVREVRSLLLQRVLLLACHGDRYRHG